LLRENSVPELKSKKLTKGRQRSFSAGTPPSHLQQKHKNTESEIKPTVSSIKEESVVGDKSKSNTTDPKSETETLKKPKPRTLLKGIKSSQSLRNLTLSHPRGAVLLRAVCEHIYNACGYVFCVCMYVCMYDVM